MTAQTPTTLKSYFQAGDRPTQTQFADTIDSFINVVQTSGQSIVSDISALGDVVVSGALTVQNSAMTTLTGNVNIGGSLIVSTNVSISGQTTLASAKSSTPTAGSLSSDIATMNNFGQGANGSSLVLIGVASANNSSSSISVAGFPSTYSNYIVIIDRVLLATTGADIYLQIGEGSPPTYKTSGYLWSSFYSNSIPTSGSLVNSSDMGFNLDGGLGVINTLGISSNMNLYGINSNIDDKQLTGSVFFQSVSGANTQLHIGGVYAGDMNAVSAVRLITSTGNLVVGSMYVYALRTL